MTRQASGFTLAEVLVAFVLLSAGALALAAAAQRLHRATADMLDRERAHALAAWAVDSLLSVDSVTPGSADAGALRLVWGGAPDLVRARLLDRRGRVVAELGARPGPSLPVLPAGSP